MNKPPLSPSHLQPTPEAGNPVKELANTYVHELVQRNQIMMTYKQLVLEINSIYPFNDEPQGWSNVTDAAQGVMIAQIEFAVSYFKLLFEKPVGGLLALGEVKDDINAALHALKQSTPDQSTATAKINEAITKLGTLDFTNLFSQLNNQWNAVISNVDQLTDALQNMITIEQQLQTTYNQEVTRLHGDISSECAPLGLVCKAIQLASLAVGPEGIFLAGAVAVVGTTTMVLIVVSINHDLEQMQTTRGQIYEISHEQGKITEIRAHFLALNARAKEIQSNNLTHKYFETQADYSNSMIQPLRSALSDLSMVDIMELESAMKQLPELVEFPTYSILDIKFVSSNLHFGMTSEQILECLDGQPSQGLMEWWLSHVS